MQDVFQAITDRIIQQLESGTTPWVRPWSGEPDPFPINALTNKPYRGLNVLSLQMETFARGYERNRWLTYRQSLSLGGHVRKGARGTPVVFWQLKRSAVADHTEPVEVDHRKASNVIPLLRIYTVFNTADIDGLPADLNAPSVDPCWDGNARAEGILTDSGATIAHAGFRAFYRRDTDLIQLPRRECFATAGDYYATALHELGHWSGHESRCNRQFGKRFGDQAYAFEELVAELSAAFLCATCRIDGRLEHATYIDHWLRILRADKRAVLLAATQAQKAADYLLALSAKDDEAMALPLAA